MNGATLALFYIGADAVKRPLGFAPTHRGADTPPGFLHGGRWEARRYALGGRITASKASDGLKDAGVLVDYGVQDASQKTSDTPQRRPRASAANRTP